MLEKFSNLRQKLFAPLLFKINPTIISVMSFIFALIASYFFFTSIWLFAAIFLALNAFFDAFDGEVARKYKLETKLGDLVDHVFDRIADVALFLGLAFNPSLPKTLTLLTLISILLASYAGVQAQALVGKRIYSALIGRADRLLILFFATLLMPFYSNALYYAILIIGILSLLTFFQRTLQIVLTLKHQKD
jgi:phosphatidylglycerophosphate synthase